MLLPRIRLVGNRALSNDKTGNDMQKEQEFTGALEEDKRLEQTVVDHATRSASTKAPLHFSEPRRSLTNCVTSSLKNTNRSKEETLDKAINSSDKFVDQADKIKELRKHIYTEGRYYQGTTKSEVEKWRSQDMDPQNKGQSSWSKARDIFQQRKEDQGFNERDVNRSLEFEDDTVKKNVYFTKLKTNSGYPDNASFYAALKSSREDPPKISRSFFDKTTLENLKIVQDTNSRKNEGFRTDQTVPLGYTLQAKYSPVKITLASELYKNAFNTSRLRTELRINTHITSKEAAEMLREDQTPSPMDEFPILRPPFDKLDYRSPKALENDIKIAEFAIESLKEKAPRLSGFLKSNDAKQIAINNAIVYAAIAFDEAIKPLQHEPHSSLSEQEKELAHRASDQLNNLAKIIQNLADNASSYSEELLRNVQESLIKTVIDSNNNKNRKTLRPISS